MLWVIAATFNVIVFVAFLVVYRARRASVVRSRGFHAVCLQSALALVSGNVSYGLGSPYVSDPLTGETAISAVLCTMLQTVQAGFLILVVWLQAYQTLGLFVSYYLTQKKHSLHGDEPPGLNMIQRYMAAAFVPEERLKPSYRLAFLISAGISFGLVAPISALLFTPFTPTRGGAPSLQESASKTSYCFFGFISVPLVYATFSVMFSVASVLLIANIKDLNGKSMEISSRALAQYFVSVLVFFQYVFISVEWAHVFAELWLLFALLLQQSVSVCVITMFDASSASFTRNDVGSFASFKHHLELGLIDKTLEGCQMLEYALFWREYVRGCERFGLAIEYTDARPVVWRINSAVDPEVTEYTFVRELIDNFLKDGSIECSGLFMAEYTDLVDLAPVFSQATEKMFQEAWPMFGLDLSWAPMEIRDAYSKQRTAAVDLGGDHSSREAIMGYQVVRSSAIELSEFGLFGSPSESASSATEVPILSRSQRAADGLHRQNSE